MALQAVLIRSVMLTGDRRIRTPRAPSGRWHRANTTAHGPLGFLSADPAAKEYLDDMSIPMVDTNDRSE